MYKLTSQPCILYVHIYERELQYIVICISAIYCNIVIYTSKHISKHKAYPKRTASRRVLTTFFFRVFYQDNWARPVEPRSLTSPLQDLMYVCIQYKRTLMFSHFFSTSLIMFNRMARQGLPAEKNSIFSGLSTSAKLWWNGKGGAAITRGIPEEVQKVTI